MTEEWESQFPCGRCGRFLEFTEGEFTTCPCDGKPKYPPNMERLRVRTGPGMVALVVAASNASERSKGGADFQCDGIADDVQIQAAVDALPSGGGEVKLTEGTFTMSAQITRAIDDVSIVGSGSATVLNLDASTAVISAGSQARWNVRFLNTDAGGVDISTATQSRADYWKNGSTTILGGGVTTLTHLDDILTILGSTKTHLWPFFESTGIDVQSYGEQDTPLLAGEAAAQAELNDPATGWAPYRHPGGIHSYHFEGGDDQHLLGADAAALSFAGGTDAAFSIGCWFYTEGATGTLIAKYDVGGTLREYRLHLLSGPDLALEVFDESIDDSETAQTTTALSTRQWYFGVVTYGGAGGDGGGGSEKEAADDMIIYVDGAAVAATVSEVGGAYLDMEDTAAGILIGATDDLAVPANEFTGRIALPFITGQELTAAEVASLYTIGKELMGL